METVFLACSKLASKSASPANIDSTRTNDSSTQAVSALLMHAPGAGAEPAPSSAASPGSGRRRENPSIRLPALPGAPLPNVPRSSLPTLPDQHHPPASWLPGLGRV